MNYKPYEPEDSESLFVKDNCSVSLYRKPADPNELYEVESKGYVTSGESIDTSKYLRSFPYDLDILRNAYIIELGEHDENVTLHARKFLSIFQRVLQNNRNIINYSTSLPPLRFNWLEDNSLLVEWIFKDFRVGFSIEPKIQKSGWYLVSNQNLDEISTSALINFNELEPLLLYLFSFVLGHA